MSGSIFWYLMVIIACTGVGCANIATPSGGKKDTIPPKLLSVSPADSQLNSRITKVELRFDEYVTVGDVQKEVETSPILAFPPSVTAINKHVTVKLEDSLLEENTTYRISFGKAIKDVHEGNQFAGYTYIFSTGGYFDTLELRGVVKNAATGMPDSSGAIVVLYRASDDDSSVVKKKPRYMAKTDARGAFHFKGLPGKDFRIYAVKDDNNNMTYDGGGEQIAFANNVARPGDSATKVVTLSLFKEVADSGAVTDTMPKASKKNMRERGKPGMVDTNLVYTTNIDTSNKTRRTFDAADSVKLVFNREPVLDMSKIWVSRDSGDAPVKVPARVYAEARKPAVVYAVSAWAENTLYTLHLDDGFARDTANRQAMPAKYTFRTFNGDDYGKIKLILPGKYSEGKAAVNKSGSQTSDHLLVVRAGDAVIYQQRIADTAIFKTLRPATYTFCIIVDKNKNGKWDTGDLFGKVQPEEVIPGPAPITLKAGWEHNVDFDTPPKPAEKKDKSKR